MRKNCNNYLFGVIWRANKGAGLCCIVPQLISVALQIPRFPEILSQIGSVFCPGFGRHASRTKIGKGEGRTIQRYIRLTELAPPLLERVDQKRIAFSPAVELSYLTKQEQAELWSLIESEDCTPSFSQSVRMKKLSHGAKLSPEVIYAVMTEEKPNQKEQVRIQTDKLKKYFPRGYTASQMETAIFKLLEERQQKRQRREETR